MADSVNWDNVTQVTPTIKTSAPNWDNVQAVQPRPEQTQSSPIGRAIRWVMKGTPWEQWSTYNYVMNKYKDSKIDWNNPKDREQVQKDAAEYEDKKAAVDPWQQVAVPMAAGTALFVGQQFATKTPLGAAATIGATAAGGFAADKLLPLKEWFNKANPNASPLARDTVSIIDGLKNMVGMGVSAHKVGGMADMEKSIFEALWPGPSAIAEAQKPLLSGATKPTHANVSLPMLLNSVLNIAGAKPSVDLTPEHIEDLQTHPSITDRERADALKTMGIDQTHIEQSAKTGSPINVPADKVLDLAKKPYYGKIRDIFNKPEEPKTGEVKANLSAMQKAGDKLGQWSRAVGRGLNFTKRMWYNFFNSYMPVREKFGGATEDPVFRAILSRDRESLGFRNKKSEIFDKTFEDMKSDFNNKYSDQVLDDLMLTRGKANSEEAVKLQLEALERLPEELRDNNVQRGITEASDYVRERIIKAGVNINYHDDYIRGAYKWPNPEDAEDYIVAYKNTDSFTKAKIYPTYADIKAKYPDIKLREPNPIKSLETEMRAGMNRTGLKYLKNQIMSEITGEPERITNATVRVGNAYSDGASHEEALNKLGLSKDTMQEGGDFEPLFRTNWNRLLTRNQADKEFGISSSEDIAKQTVKEPAIHQGYAVMVKDMTRLQKFNWNPINDKEFSDMRFHPSYAKFVNNLLATNKISQEGLTGGLAGTAKFFQVLKFSLSAFHFKNIAKGQIANEAYGIFDPRGYQKIIANMGKFDQTDPEYMEYVGNIAGSHYYSMESDAQRAVTNSLRTLTKKMSEGTRLKMRGVVAAGKFLPGSPEFIRWMFDEYIPKVKFESWKSEVAYQEAKQGRQLQDWEKRDIARTLQNFYGEMNEKLFGRSGTTTSALRLIFSAPGYGEGNFRALAGSMAELRDTAGAAFGITKIPKNGYKNTQFIVNSMINAMVIGAVSTRILTGKWPGVPQNGNDVRDLFKTKTNWIDGNGDAIYFDNMDYANDFYSIYGNVLTGQVTNIPKTLGQRVTGAESVPFQMLIDMANVFAGRTIVDYRNLPVFEKTDDPIQKINKYMAYRALTAIPIMANVFGQYTESGVPAGISFAAAVSGTRKTVSENVKISKDIRNDIFDLKLGKEKVQGDLNKLYKENPEQAEKEAEAFNDEQLKKADNLINKLDKLNVTKEDLQGTPADVKELFNKSINSFLINNFKSKSSEGSEEVPIELTDKQQAMLDKMSNVEQ